MLSLVTTGAFRKDYKRIKKRGYDRSLLENVIDVLLAKSHWKIASVTMHLQVITSDSGNVMSCQLASDLCDRSGVSCPYSLPYRNPCRPV